MNVNLNLLDDGEKLALAISLIEFVIKNKNLESCGTNRLKSTMKHIGAISDELKESIENLFDWESEKDWRYTTAEVVARMNDDSSSKNQAHLNKVGIILKDMFGEYKAIRRYDENGRASIKSRVYFCPKFKD